MRFQHWKLFHSKSNCCIKHPQKSSETYLFYGTVHLMKTSEIRNLLNKTSLCFQSLFMMITFIIKISCSAGFTRWVDLYSIYNKDKELKNNLKKTPKSSYLALHPGNNKQNVRLALAVLHETTITAARNYFPNRRDVASFFEIFNTWWTILNFKKRFSPNILRNAVINGDKKLSF